MNHVNPTHVSLNTSRRTLLVAEQRNNLFWRVGDVVNAHVTWRHTNCCFCNMTKRHHASTVRWQLSWTVSNDSAEEYSTAYLSEVHYDLSQLIAGYFEVRTEHINALCGQNVEF